MPHVFHSVQLIEAAANIWPRGCWIQIIFLHVWGVVVFEKRLCWPGHTPTLFKLLLVQINYILSEEIKVL